MNMVHGAQEKGGIFGIQILFIRHCGSDMAFSSFLRLRRQVPCRILFLVGKKFEIQGPERVFSKIIVGHAL
ncbi:hypothetical protein [uncultured Desulfovibrio sp.]|uniref:hypothetical protein n=1 Tax=uncultured Desulfovibrio sp. TaxID=167968 RepID=UPI00261A346F|nr:hypothetical protein [uncultured Desulfovibrio sp.]